MTIVRQSAVDYFRFACAICAVALMGVAIAHAQGGPKASATTASATTSNAPPNALQGFSQNRDKPIQIDAARLEVRDKDKVATFFGDAKADVKVIQGDTTMRSKKLVVFYEQDEAAKAGKAAKAASPGPGGSSQIKRLEAIGNVIVTQKDQTVTGETGIFEMKTNTITMSGGVVMTQADNVVQGDKLIVDMGTGVSRVETAPGGRVKALLKSNSKDSGGAPDAGKQGKSGPLGLVPGR